MAMLNNQRVNVFTYFRYPKTIFNMAMVQMALIEIDGLPFLIAWVDLSMANCECHSQMVIFYMVDGEFFFNVHQPFLMVNNHGWLYIYS